MTDNSAPPSGPALRAAGLGHRFRARGRSGWALRDCDFALPAGHITALVGPNGAGKTTLFRIAADLARPTEGTLEVCGYRPGTPEARAHVAFLAQDKPLYPRWSVADTLRMGRALNRRWDQAGAERVVRAGNIALDARVGALSSGQRTRVALALVLGRTPSLLLLDEPLADLDPVVREEVMGVLMAEVMDRELTVVLSSHVLPDIEHSCDHVLLLGEGRVRLAGDTDTLRATHTLVTGRAGTPEPPDLVHARRTGRQITALARIAEGTPVPDGWAAETPSLEDILLGHLRAASAGETGETGEAGAGAGPRDSGGIAEAAA